MARSAPGARRALPRGVAARNRAPLAGWPDVLLLCCASVQRRVGGAQAKRSVDASGAGGCGPSPLARRARTSLIRADHEGNALLLERIVPGDRFSGDTSHEDIESVARLLALRIGESPTSSKRGRARTSCFTAISKARTSFAAAGAASWPLTRCRASATRPTTPATGSHPQSSHNCDKRPGESCPATWPLTPTERRCGRL